MVTTYYKVPVPPPLDTVAGAVVAVGLRKLSTSYTGKCCRIRRSSDNSEQDIGFNGLDFDISAYNAFVGGNTGFITILYDQSGNGYNATQTVAIYQPQLILNFQAGRPVMRFTSSSQTYLSFGKVLGRPLNYTIVATYAITNLSAFMFVYGSSDPTGNASNCWGTIYVNRVLGSPNRLPPGVVSWAHGNLTGYAYDSMNAILAVNKLAIISESYASGVRPEELRKSSVTVKPLDTNGTATTNEGTIYNYSLGRAGDCTTGCLDGYILDFIHYASKLTDTQQGNIEYSNNDYYSIF